MKKYNIEISTSKTASDLTKALENKLGLTQCRACGTFCEERMGEWQVCKECKEYIDREEEDQL